MVHSALFHAPYTRDLAFGPLRASGMPPAFPSRAAADRWPSIRRAGDAGWPCVGWRRWLPSATG